MTSETRNPLITENRALPIASEVPVSVGGPSRTRTLDPLIKSNPLGISTELHDDVKLEDLYTWN